MKQNKDDKNKTSSSSSSTTQKVIIMMLVIIISFLMTERLIMYDEDHDHYIKGLYSKAKVYTS